MAATTSSCSLSIGYVRGASSEMRVAVASASLPLADVFWVRRWALGGSRENDEGTAGDERVAASLRGPIGLPPGFPAAHLPASALRPFVCSMVQDVYPKSARNVFVHGGLHGVLSCGCVQG